MEILGVEILGVVIWCFSLAVFVAVLTSILVVKAARTQNGQALMDGVVAAILRRLA